MTPSPHPAIIVVLAVVLASPASAQVGGGASKPSAPSSQPTAPVPAESPANILPADQPYPPLAESPGLRKPIVWEWQRFNTGDWIVTSLAASTVLVTSVVKPRSTHWEGGVGFDESARDTFRLSSQTARYSARDVSDVLLSLEATWPFFVDALILGWWYHGSPDTASEMALIDAEALTIVAAVQRMTTVLASRERPYGRTCNTDILPAASQDCEGSSRYRSFFSGHSAISFVSASLICVHHMKLELLGSRSAAVATCAIAYVGATGAAMARVLSDMHYTSDTIVGALVGTAVGVGLPLWKYRKRNPRRGEALSPVQVTLIPFGMGLGVGGIF